MVEHSSANPKVPGSISGHPKKNFFFRSSVCPFLKPVGRPHCCFFPLIFFLVGKYCPFLEKKEVPIRTFLNHPAATPETEVFLVWPQAWSHSGVMDYDEACFMHLTPGVVHNVPKAVGV